MTGQNIFVSVGATCNDEQEKFVVAVEERLRSEGLVPYTVGRNTFSSGAPLKKVIELLDDCQGMVVIALERSFFPSGVDKRGSPDETPLTDIRLPTTWNHIEAAMAYSRRLPLMVIVESGLKNEGLLEYGYDWYVQRIKPQPSALMTKEFNGVLADWKSKVILFKAAPKKTGDDAKSIDQLTIAQLLGSLRLAQLWSFLGALATLLAAAFAAGAKLG
jgi:hypothetical protein